MVVVVSGCGTAEAEPEAEVGRTGAMAVTVVVLV